VICLGEVLLVHKYLFSPRVPALRAICSANVFLFHIFIGQTSHPVILGSTEPILIKFSP